MRNYTKIIGALAAVSALAAGNASALEVDYNLHAGYTSEYLFRGTNLGTDLAEAGFDASADFAGLNIAAGVWYANFNAPIGAATGIRDDQNEIDLYASVSKDLGFLTATVGYIYYYNDQDDVSNIILRGGRDLSDAQEVTFGVSKDFGFAQASLTYYWDVVTDNDGYAEAALKKSIELNSCLTLNLGTTLGYLAEEGHLAHLTGKVSLDYAFAEHAKVSPFIAGSVDLSGGHGGAYATAKNQLVGGAMISVDF